MLRLQHLVQYYKHYFDLKAERVRYFIGNMFALLSNKF